MKIAVVRRTDNDEIIDAIQIRDEEALKRNLSAELSEKWPPYSHYIQTVLTNYLSGYFSKENIMTIRKILKAKLAGDVAINPTAIRTSLDMRVQQHTDSLVEMLKRFITQYKGDAIIVTGEAHYKIYNEELYQTIKQTPTNSKNRLVFICGPILVVDDKFRDNRIEGSIIPRLWELPNVDIYCSETRQDIHFRLGGSEALYVEDPHHPAADERIGWLFEKDPEIGKKFREMAEYLLRSKAVYKSERPESDFIFLTLSQLHRLKEAVERKKAKDGKDYSERTKENFSGIINSEHLLES